MRVEGAATSAHKFNNPRDIAPHARGFDALDDGVANAGGATAARAARRSRKGRGTATAAAPHAAA